VSQDGQDTDAENHCFECFIEETLYAKKKALDLSNSLQDYAMLDGLVDNVEEAVSSFETRWTKKVIKASRC